jgi:uncharacterized protein (UPF0333 family)
MVFVVFLCCIVYYRSRGAPNPSGSHSHGHTTSTAQQNIKVSGNYYLCVIFPMAPIQAHKLPGNNCLYVIFPMAPIQQEQNICDSRIKEVSLSQMNEVLYPISPSFCHQGKKTRL